MTDFVNQYRDYILAAYRKGESTHSIAKVLKTYPNKIRRALEAYGEPIRNDSEAQKLSLAHGRRKHPTEGTKLSEETKEKISESCFKVAQNVSPEQKEKMKVLRKKNWDDKTDGEKDEFFKKAAVARQAAAKNGSKLEKFIQSYLTNERIWVLFHKRGLIPREDLEVDLFVPALKTAIEVDGIFHREAVFSQDELDKKRSSDMHKNGLLINAGYAMIRLKCIQKNYSTAMMREVCKKLVEKLRSIEKRFPSLNERLIEIEV